jgi:hypothetical protein
MAGTRPLLHRNQLLKARDSLKQRRRSHAAGHGNTRLRILGDKMIQQA